MRKDNRKNENISYKKQSFIKRNISKILVGAAMLAGAAGLGIYFHTGERDITALDNLTKNGDYKLFYRKHAEPKDKEIASIIRTVCKSEGKDVSLVKDVSVKIEKEVSLLPQTSAFQNLEQRLNRELELFEKALPKELPRKAHRIKLPSLDADLENLPIEENKVVQMYLVNSAQEKFSFWLTYQGRGDKLYVKKNGNLGESTFNLSWDYTKDKFEFTIVPQKVYISPSYACPKGERYAWLLNTTFSEYLHSVLQDLKIEATKELTSDLSPKKPSDIEKFNKRLYELRLIDEGTVHATVLSYLENKGLSKTVESERKKFAESKERGFEGMTRINEFYEIINSTGLTKEDKLKPLLNLWHQGNIRVLLKDKESIIEYINKNYQIKN